jgi:hypothetical protein
MMSRMRSSVIANALVATVPALIVVGALGSAGCKKKENKPAQDKSETASASEEEGGEPAEVPKTGQTHKSLAPRGDFVKITQEEIQPLVPQLTGGQVVGEAKSIGGGRRINVTVCVSGVEPQQVKAELEKRFGDLGVTSIAKDERLRRHHRKGWFSMRGEKNGVHISATSRTAEYPDCKASEKKTRVTLTYYRSRQQRRQPAGGDAAGSGQPPAAGAPAAPAAPGGAQPQGQLQPAEGKPAAGGDAGSSG